MSTNPSLVRTFTDSQNLYTISHPYADIVGFEISDVSQASPAVVTAAKSLPGTFTPFTAVNITGVEGMTELATAGENGSSKFYVYPVDSTSFQLYTDSLLYNPVDSTGFTAATVDTGMFQIFSVTEYKSVGARATVIFQGISNNVGADIAVDTGASGFITLTGGDNTYQLTGIANVNSAGATYQWYDFTNDVFVGYPQAVGTPVTAIFKNDADANLGLVVISKEGTTFQYPAQITDAEAVIEVVSGFIS